LHARVPAWETFGVAGCLVLAVTTLATVMLVRLQHKIIFQL
jgi:hypothetical protein